MTLTPSRPQAQQRVRAASRCPAALCTVPPHVLSVLLAVLAFLVILPGVPSAADLSDAEILKILTTEPPRDKAIRRGLEYLRHHQKADGLFGDKHVTALTGLTLMAHFAAGHTLEDPSYGDALRRAVSAVLSRQDPDGYFGRQDDSRMYGHGIAALMLAEALGMTRDDELEERMHRALEKAVRVTVNAALVKKRPGHEGGWRYQPNQDDSDLSLSGWQLMSLHAVQQVGMPVPEKVVQAATDYAKRLTSADGKVGYSNPGEDRPALRGLALLCFAIAGDHQVPQIQAVASRILSDPIKWEGEYFFYRAYYEAVGLSRAAPAQWLSYAPKLEGLLVERQKEDGSWDAPGNEAGIGPVYATSMGVLALAVQRHVLPAYQR